MNEPRIFLHVMFSFADIRKQLGEKAIKEDWQEKKTREIRRALKEKPFRQKQILSQDYSDPYEGSNQWKLKLEGNKLKHEFHKTNDFIPNNYKILRKKDRFTQFNKIKKVLKTH